MDKTIFYKKLDIDGPEEFIYYDNLSALLEEDDFIEENLIKDLLKDVDKNTLTELFETYFEEFLKAIPDEESDLYVTVDSIKMVIMGLITNDMDDNDIADLAEEIIKFRKWYVQDLLAYDINTGNEVSVRDARYDIIAAGLLGEKYNYDFRLACDYDADGYDLRLGDIEIREKDID